MRVIALLLAAGSLGAGPAYPELVQAARLDASKIGPLAYRYRYLARPLPWTDKEWVTWVPTVVGHLNQISRSALLYPPRSDDMRLVGAGLLRVNVYELGYLEVFDRLQDPYFYADEYKDREWGYYTDPVKKTGWVTTDKKRERIRSAPSQILMDGPADEKALNELQEMLRTQVPMVRADWFVNQTIASENRDPGYPEFLGFKDEKDFARITGFDKAVSKAFTFEVRDAVSRSGVTLQPRAIVRFDSTGAGTWLTRDFLLPKDETDPLEVVGDDIERAFQASEQYGTLPNRLWAYGAFTGPGAKDDAGKLVGAGKLQRRVPEQIATNNVSHSNDKGIHMGVSCIICHGKGGLKDIRPWFREVIETPIKADFRVRYGVDAEKKEKELRQQYQSDLLDLFNGDRLRYEKAIFKATGGLTSEKFAKATEELWDRYENAEVDTAYAAAEFGWTPAEFRRRLKVQMDYSKAEIDAGRPGLYIPAKIGSLRHEGALAQKIDIRSWERSFQQAYLLLRGVK